MVCHTLHNGKSENRGEAYARARNTDLLAAKAIYNESNNHWIERLHLLAKLVQPKKSCDQLLQILLRKEIFRMHL